MSEFGAVLRSFRRTAGLSQEKLAEASGVSVEAIKTLETGRRRHPRPQTLESLATGLGLTETERAEFVAAGTRTRTTRHRPEQLPDDLPDFSGRDEQIADLEKLFSAGEARQGVVVVSAVAGMGGIGKTTLGVHVAHRVSELFPDGQLYVNLRGFGPGEPMTAAAALTRLLSGLGVPGDGSSDVDQLAARYRSALAGRRVFVFLDNAASEAQVLPLMPGTSTCAVLVTSRRMLTGLPGAAQLALDALPEPDALSLLARIVGDGRIESDAANARLIVRICGGLPLALRIAGARLAAEPSRTVADFAQRLATGHRRLDELALGDLDVRTSIEMSLSSATERDAGAVAAFRRLGLYEGDELDVRVAARLLDLPVTETEQRLERLVDLHLLESPAPRRYQFHDLVRAYLQELPATEAERHAARERVMALYVAMIWRARTRRGIADSMSREWLDESWLSGTDDLEYEEILSWFDVEAAETLAAARRMMSGPHPDLGAVVKLAVGMMVFWADRARYAEGAQLGELALTALRLDPDCAPDRSEASIRYNVARIYSALSDFEAAIVHISHAIEVSAATGYRWILTYSRIGLAQFLERLDRLDESVEQAQAGLELALADADGHAEGEARFTLGVIAGRLGHPAEQDREFELAAQLVRAHNPPYILWLGHAIGDAYRRGGRLQKAHSWLLAGMPEVHNFGSQYSVAEALQLLGVVEVELAAYGAARGHLEEALTLIGSGRGELEAGIRQALGDALSGLGEADRAQEQWRLARQVRDRYGLG